MNKKLLPIVATIAVLAVLASVAVAQTGIPGTGWWSGEQVQNVGTATANLVVTAYDKNGAATFTSSQTAAVGAAFTFIPDNFVGMPDGFIGSAVVSSDQPIKAIVNVTNQAAGSFGVAGGKAAAQYQGTENTATSLYFPLVKHNYYGGTTSFYIQNAGTAAASVTAVFKTASGTYTKTVASVAPNKMVVISPVDASVPAGNTTNSLGSLTVTSAQPLAGTVLEYQQAQTIATVLNGTRGFTAADFDTKAYAPVIKNGWYGRFTGLQVQNVSGSPIDVTVVYVGGPGSPAACAGKVFSDTASAVAPGTSKTFVHLTGQTNLVSNCYAAATVSATGNFVAIVNEQNTAANPVVAGITYSALPDSSKTTKVSVPLFKEAFYGSSTGLQIQNVGSATATNVVATFACTKQAGGTFTAVSTAQTIGAGGSKLFYRPSTMAAGTFTVGNPFSNSSVNCAVTIVGDQPLVAIANENTDFVGALDDNNYEGFNLAP
jgi:hypothetical protein